MLAKSLLPPSFFINCFFSFFLAFIVLIKMPFSCFSVQRAELWCIRDSRFLSISLFSLGGVLMSVSFHSRWFFTAAMAQHGWLIICCVMSLAVIIAGNYVLMYFYLKIWRENDLSVFTAWIVATGIPSLNNLGIDDNQESILVMDRT